nr:immunoglobulin heavy chain junction region [Mus musculus]
HISVQGIYVDTL